jgi:4-amino-4-deoxy-L-arabinose transferase-like glycosyltransferase
MAASQAEPNSGKSSDRQNSVANDPRHRRVFSLITLTALLLTFVGLVLLLPLRTTIQLGGDEGFELAKATLCLKGYKLYVDVWNDQPPLHTFLITQTLKHISPSILGPRLITAGFASLLLMAMFLMSRRINGLAIAALTTGLVIASPGFLTLGASCMLEVPCVSCSIAAMTVLFLGNRWRWRMNEVLTGVLFGAACEIKLIGAVFLPVAATIVWLNQRNEMEGKPRSRLNSWKRLIPSLFVIGTSMAVSFVVIDWLVEHGAFIKHFQQTWTSHFGGTKSFEYGSPKDHPFDWAILLRDWDASVPALAGIVFCAFQFRKSPMLLLPMGWLIFDLALFSTHTPWWSYYIVHLAPPLCWCAAIGIGEVLKLANWRRRRAAFGLVVVFLAGGGWWMGMRLYLQVQNVRHSPQTYGTLALTEIQRFKPFTQFLYADQPIYSFHSGVPMPPDLAVVMLKRLWSGDMTNAKITDELETNKPGLILLANDTRVMPFQHLLQTEYRLVYQDAIHRLYALKTIANKAEY